MDRMEPFDAPEDDALRALLAKDEAALRDNGFTRGVMREIKDPSVLRRLVLWGAGAVGGAIASMSLASLAAAMPPPEVADVTVHAPFGEALALSPLALAGMAAALIAAAVLAVQHLAAREQN